jgi:hypothetical protein
MPEAATTLDVRLGLARRRRCTPTDETRGVRSDRMVTLLTSTQLAVGLFAAARVASRWLPPSDARGLVTAGAVTLVSALLVARGHFRDRRARQPRRTPPLGDSRQAVAFFALSLATAASLASAWLVGPSAEPSTLFGTADVILGLAAVCCTAVLLRGPHAHGAVDTETARVLGTTAVLGAGALALVSSAEAVRPLAAGCAAALVVLTMLKLVGLHRLFRFEAGRDALPLARTSDLLRGRLRPLVALRVVSGVLGGIVLPVVSTAAGGIPILAVLALELCLVGEGTEYALVVRACPPTAMVGGV